MTTRLSVTIATPSTNAQHGETRKAEKNELVDLLERLQQALGSSAAATTSFTIGDRNGNGLLTATYTPTASA